MEPYGSLPCSQKSATEPDESSLYTKFYYFKISLTLDSHLRLGLQTVFSPLVLHTKREIKSVDPFWKSTWKYTSILYFRSKILKCNGSSMYLIRYQKQFLLEHLLNKYFIRVNLIFIVQPLQEAQFTQNNYFKTSKAIGRLQNSLFLKHRAIWRAMMFLINRISSLFILVTYIPPSQKLVAVFHTDNYCGWVF
jgi:hypothetical protein